MKLTVSVLLSVYADERPERLWLSLLSIARQTRLPDQLVLVHDGQLGPELDAVIDRFTPIPFVPMHQVRLQSNRGLIEALNRGIPRCTGDFVMRMDSDDLCMPNRLEAQVAFLESHPEVDVVGTAMYEFTHNSDTPEHIKPVREDHDEIAVLLPWRNPVNHATACVRRTLLHGGYPNLRFLEDYYLWVKLLGKGARFHNLDQPLYVCRFDDRTFARRSGKENFQNEVWLRWHMWKLGLMSVITLAVVTTAQTVLRFGPLGLQRWLWARARVPYLPQA